MSRNRNWCITVNNYGDEDRARLLALPYRYIVIGDEIGESGTPHLQVYVCLQNAVTFAGLQRRLPGYHLEVAMGTPQQAADYCKKEGVFVEHGELPAQGKRNDLESVRDEIKANPSITNRDLLERHPSVVARYDRFMDKCRKAYCRPATLTWTQSPNLWIYGPAGTGKSSTARSLSTSLYVKMANKWWDGYDGEDDVLIDDFHPEQAKYLTTYLKIWADRYPFPAEIKGGSLFIRPKRIFVTTQYTHISLFENGEDRAAVSRRFTQMDPTPFVVVPTESYDEKNFI